MPTEWNRERAARALVEGALRGPRQAAQRFACTQTDLKRWRRQLKTDGELQEAYSRLYAQLDRKWREELCATSRAACVAQRRVIEWALSELDREDADPADRYSAAQLAASVATEIIETAVTHEALNGDPDEEEGFAF